MDKNNQVPDFPGQIMIIESDDLSKREAALMQVLKHFEKIESFQPNKSKEIQLMSFVPEGLVAVTIGHKGRLIQKIKEETNVGVIIN